MNTKPQVTFPGFPEIKFNTVIKADDNTPEVLDWQGSNGCFKAASASGEWTLTITENSKRTDIAFTGRKNPGIDRLSVTLFQIDEFKADHVLPQAVRMGGCQAYDLKNQSKPVDFSGELLNSITKDGVTLQCSTPFHGGFPMFFEGTADKGCIRNFRAVSPVNFYGPEEFVLPVLTLRASADGFVMMEDYGDENVDVKKEFSAPDYGWNSWDYYRWTITEDEVLKNAEVIAKDPILSKHIRRIIVDDGWQYCYGEWEANHLFSSGMDSLAREITRMGFEPGLWFAPAIVEPHCRIAQWDSDMLACSAGGQPCLAFECMRRFGFILDPTVKKTQDHLEKLFRRYTDMGYRYFKLDFLFAMTKAPRYADSSIRRDELVPRLLDPICRGIDGKAVLLGCNYPYPGGNIPVEAVRIGADIHALWDRLMSNMSAVAAHFWSNKRLWYNDPDFALCRCPETSNDPNMMRMKPLYPYITPNDSFDQGREFVLAGMSRQEVEVLLSAVLMAAGAINLSDNLPLLNEDGLEMLRKLVSAESGQAARPLDLFSSALPSYYLQNLSNGHRALLVNWTDEKQVRSLDLAAYGLQTTTATDFWNGEKISVAGNRLEFELPPHSCKLLVF